MENKLAGGNDQIGHNVPRVFFVVWKFPVNGIRKGDDFARIFRPWLCSSESVHFGPTRAVDGWKITITGTAGSTVVIEGSSDLEHWAEIGSVVLSGNSITFGDPAGPSVRFYRLRQE